MRGPLWTIPIELVIAAATPAGIAEITRLRLGQALFKPHAYVELGPGGFVATVTYESPRYPGREQHLVVRLVAAPMENAA